ncbi:DUF4864 domain-containing protein [Profundibacterium mesophilum]|uniref:DUF4864 domain-containing protein n=1 Tax=Profundibacterium mesophilum KAUST100406-0324 TaxID=1037889 RepID=A0A921NXF1_9RHOB|nr:DUF4864 domain-containing protein [Profundibacterium mesophilum]KAF0675293.1 hypothetical protein PMES_02414 [Profundibacterium mesophilum KAUST100406-0324]
MLHGILLSWALAAAVGTVASFATPVPAFAQLADEQGEVRHVIEQQIEAFRAGDLETAFSFAAPSIRRLFGSPDVFGRMVEQGYPMVWSPSEVTFLELRRIEGALWQRVMVRDDSGALHMLDYQMTPGEGGWKIGGVQLLRAQDLRA